MNHEQRLAYIDDVSNAKGLDQEAVSFLRDCARWAADDQWKEIRFGLEHGLGAKDLSTYAKGRYVFDARQMREIREGLEEHLEGVSTYASPRYIPEQMRWLRHGLSRGLDVSAYADPRYSPEQMRTIVRGLSEGLDVSSFASPWHSARKMEREYRALAREADSKRFAGSEFAGLLDGCYEWADNQQLDQLRHGIESGVDISVYASPDFDESQMREVRLGLETLGNGTEVSVYADPARYSGLQMREIRLGLEHGLDVSAYADPSHTFDEMGDIRWELEREARSAAPPTASRGPAPEPREAPPTAHGALAAATAAAAARRTSKPAPRRGIDLGR